MTASRWSRRWLMASVVMAGIVAGACGSEDPQRAASAPSPTPSSPSASSAPPAPRGLDFAGGSVSDLGEGWTIAPCESGPPLFCARHDGETQATIELRTSPAASYASVKRVLDAGGSAVDALRSEAGAFHAAFAEDRPSGCGEAYVVEPIPPAPVTVAGHPGIRYGFDGRQSGRHVERALLFSTIVGDELHIISTTAIDDGSCMDDGELEEFTTEELAKLQPRLEQVLAASTLPTG